MSSEIIEGGGCGEDAKRSRETGGNQKDVRKYLLALLAANHTAPITGKVLLVKQVFIIAKEIVPDISEKMHFFPYQWGPYSNVLANEINCLLDEGLLEVTKEGRDITFHLTPSGQEVGVLALENLSEDIRNDISKMKETTQDVGLKKLLQYIYTHYPQYAVYSKGKEVYGNS